MRYSLHLIVVLLLAPAARGQVIDFEDVPVPPAGYYNGSDNAGGFTSRGARFNNSYSAAFAAWSGWSYSRVTDVTTQGFGNQYAAYNLPAGSGDNSPTYGVAFNFSPGDATVQLPAGTRPQSMRVTNTTYAALTMLDGDPNGFARKFDTAHQDYFLLTIEGLNALGAVTGTVNFYLADYRVPSSVAQPYVISQWTTVDLTPLGNAQSLEFVLTSSDTGAFGTNTPTYFAMDNLTVAPVPEPGALALVGVVAAAGVARRRRGKASGVA